MASITERHIHSLNWGDSGNTRTKARETELLLLNRTMSEKEAASTLLGRGKN